MTDPVTRLVAVELASVPITAAVPLAARYAETTAMLRFGGGVQHSSRGLAVTAVFTERAAAVRLRGEIVTLHGLHATLVTSPESGGWRVTVVRDALYLARRVGLLDAAGRPTPDLPLDPWTCTFAEGHAILRAAFLASGQIKVVAAGDGRPGSRGRLSLDCPPLRVGLWLTAYLRRCGITAHRSRTVNGPHIVETVQVRQPRAVGELLAAMGAPAAARLLGDPPRPRRRRSPQVPEPVPAQFS